MFILKLPPEGPCRLTCHKTQEIKHLPCAAAGVHATLPHYLITSAPLLLLLSFPCVHIHIDCIQNLGFMARYCFHKHTFIKKRKRRLFNVFILVIPVQTHVNLGYTDIEGHCGLAGSWFGVTHAMQNDI